jgi:3-oxoacyl-[acyl-carrier protein] reductase
MNPLGRLGEPQDIASAILWLLDPVQSWVTGQVIGVDGGLAVLRGRQSAWVSPLQAGADAKLT